MAINNFVILNYCYNCIDKNKQGIGNWMNLRNTDPLNSNGRNNCSIIISNKITNRFNELQNASHLFIIGFII